MHYIIYLIFGYLALVLQMVPSPYEPVTRHLPVLIVVLMSFRMTYYSAIPLSFLFGLALDAVGVGPLGLQAGLLMLISGCCAKTVPSDPPPSLRRTLLTLFVACFADTFVPVAYELASLNAWSQIQTVGWNCVSSALGVSLVTCATLALISQLFSSPRWSER